MVGTVCERPPLPRRTGWHRTRRGSTRAAMGRMTVGVGDMTVWAVCSGHGDDLKGLEAEHGPVRYVNFRYVYPDELTEDLRLPHEFERNLLLAADAFDFATDQLLLIGDHLQMVALVALLERRRTITSGQQPLQVLRYDRKAEGHVLVRI